MSVEQEILGFASTGEKPSYVSAIGLHPLQQAASRLGDYRDGKSRVRAKDLVGLLLCHGARAWRASASEACARAWAWARRSSCRVLSIRRKAWNPSST